MRYKFLLALAGCVFTTQLQAAELKVAVAGPMTGQDAVFGEQMRQGAQGAVEAINAAGGINGTLLKLIVMDDACDPKQAVAIAGQLAGQNTVAAIGHYCSGASIPASKIYDEEGIVQITPASTNPQLTEQGLKNVFRICGRDDQQGKVAAAYILEKFKGKKIAVLNDKTSYGQGLAAEAEKVLRNAGVKPVLSEAVNKGDKDFSAMVSRLKQAGAEILFYGGYHTEAGLLVRQMRSQGLTTRLIGGDALVTKEFWEITGDSGKGTLMTFGPDPRQNPVAAKVVSAFREKGYEPEGYTLYTYAALQTVQQALTKDSRLRGEALAAQIRSQSHDTVLGAISFDAKGDVKQPAYVMYEWQNGTYAMLP